MIGVGILGAGPVTQAIHLPALARLTGTFRVVRVMDVSAEVARAVADRVGATWTTDVEQLLSDPAVEVVAVCSPHRFHAEQVIAACRAGKKAILCEKPFAMTSEEAERIAAVSAETGVPILVGAMHAYDPAWLAVSDRLATGDVHTVRSSIVLPPNTRFEDFATEVEGRPEPAEQGSVRSLEQAAEAITGGIMGLAIHDLPLVRALVGPGWDDIEVHSAEMLDPFGYLIVLTAGRVQIELHALMSDNWAPDWRLTAIGVDTVAEIEFTPSYVQAGSGTASLVGGGLVRTFLPADHNGYEGEWREIASAVDGAPPRIAADALIDDLRFALEIARRAADRVLAGEGVLV
ncbi:oxidoreductase [Rathayibacter sp. Leaf299]|uniref:Gfo/Idh/MocA family protein n=1 Tax=Rathayibacter sp. Leaf299 TaxID=1736328 RepID=UPI0006F5B4A4|nr:Gfo/Idh/MocA family oxidoreductase [Rathayibacter sp. Leaf299]KQQ21920.1 oxidoreductase [Rathayibacter sp. Leaf299]